MDEVRLLLMNGMNTLRRTLVLFGYLAFLSLSQATMAVTIETVPIGNPGNAGELSGEGAGGWGPDAIVGGVDYTFRMGKFEVTAGQYAEFLNAVADTDTHSLYNTSMWSSAYGCKIERTGSSGSYVYSVASDWADRPVTLVSWGDSARFANWLTNGQPSGGQGPTTTEDGSYYLNGATTDAQLMAVTRKTPPQGGRYYVPTEGEWYKAAYHKNDGLTANYWNYPTDTGTTPSNVLSGPDPGNNANFYSNQSGYTIGSPYYRTEVGEFELSASSYGTFDQGGNVWEWNEATFSELYRGLRGGDFNNGSNNLLASDRGHLHDPTAEDQNVGFRISEIPEPATLSLLALGACLPLLRRRRRK